MQSTPDNAELTALVRAAQAGDRTAAAQLLESVIYIIYAAVRTRVPESDVEDVMQEVRLAVFEALPALNEPRTYRAWLRTITRRKIADHYEAGDKAVSVGPTQDDEDGYQDALEAVENWEVIQERLAEVPRRQWTAVFLHAVEELSFTEVGEVLGVSKEGARSLFRNGKVKILTIMDRSDRF